MSSLVYEIIKYSIVVLLLSSRCLIIDLIIRTHTDDNNPHPRLRPDKLVHNPYPGRTKINLVQACQVLPILVSQRLSVTALIRGKRILPYLSDRL